MKTRSKGPLAGLGWLTRGIHLSFRHPKPLLGGAAILMLACLLPSLVTLPLQFYSLHTGVHPDPAIVGGLAALSALAGLLIVPLYAGYLQMVDMAARGLPARARDVFKPYQQGEASRLIGYGLAILAIYVAVIAIVVAATGGGLARWYMQVLAAQNNHQLPPTALPAGFGTAMALFMVLGLFMMGLYAISLGQVALRRRNVFGAISDGMVGAFKNLLPLLVFAASLVVAWVVVLIALFLLAGLLAVAGNLLSGWLVLLMVLVVVIPLYVAFVVTILAVMFGVMYFLWRDVCGDDASASVVPALA